VERFKDLRPGTKLILIKKVVREFKDPKSPTEDEAILLSMALEKVGWTFRDLTDAIKMYTTLWNL